MAAQHTVVKSNGTAGKIEMDYNAAEKVTEIRTIGADGKLQQKVDYEYLPGYYGAQQTDATYWSSGEVRRVARNTYDESTNFTGEFIQVFDESGKQINGHKLTHDPWTGVYRCSEWSVAAQNYKVVQCPEGEEGSGESEVPKKFTYDEVMRHLEAARKARQEKQEQQRIGRMQPVAPLHTPTANRHIGLVLPARVRPGQRVSGTVVENSEQYDEMPEVTVTKLAIPLDSIGEASPLGDWFFEAAGETRQRADGPISFVVPRGGSGLNIIFRRAGNPTQSVSQTLHFPKSSAKKTQRLKSFEAAALCLKGGLCIVSGLFSGDSRKTFAAWEDRPATIIGETPDAAYIDIPDLTEPGARPLLIAEASKVIAFPVVVGAFIIQNNQRELNEGQTLIVFPTLDGPRDIPDPGWRAAKFSAINLMQARQLIPGFLPLKSNCANRQRHGAKVTSGSRKRAECNEKLDADEKNNGEIVLIVKNVTPEQISLRGSKNEALIFRLSAESFSRGEFKYDLVVEAKTSGKVDVKGYVIPFVAPVAGQEFTNKTAAGNQ
jgi:hypothetical protein